MIRDPPAMHKPDNANSQQDDNKYGLTVNSNVAGSTGGARLCAQCGKVITERFLLKAMERFWHEDCLKCGCCDCRLGEVGSKLYYKADLMLCKRDYLRLFGATGNCVACNKVIPAFEMVMRAKSFVYHLECFACQQCNHRFCVGDRFYLCDNKILCEYDYEERLVFASMAANPSGLAHIRRQVSGLQPRNHFQYQQHNDKKKLEMDLQDAIINGSLAEVEEIVATRLNNNVNTRLDSGWTALMHACFHAQDAIVKYLLEEGADPNFRSDSMTPIMTVCSNSNANNKVVYNIVTNLLEKNCKLNCMDNYGQTPLMKAVGCGRVDIVQKFLDLGVNIEVRDLQGWTALFWAAHHNQPQILEILIAHGARMSEVDKYNRTALDLAELHEYNEVAEILKKHLQIPEDHEESFDMEMTTWHDFYPGIKKGKSPDYKSEIPHLLYGMHLENFTKTIMKSGMDLRTFLLLEENDMVKLGMDLPYERQRLKNGLRHFHKRNWKLKAVSGLALQTTDNFSMLNYLTSLGSHLHQIYVLETTLQYTLREYNKIQDQIKFEPPESPIREKMVNAAKKMLSNIDCIKRASARVRIVLEKIAEENPEPADLIREKTMRDVVLGYFTEAVVVACIGIMVYQARNFFSQFLRK